MPEHQCDVLVVGSGAAGLSSALAAAKAGRAVTIMTRESIADSSSDLAQGGLAAVWGSDDSFALHLEDTLTAGAGLCHRDNVDDLVHHAPQALRHLMELGAHFDTDADGQPDLHLEGGHHARRVLHAECDRSGHEVHQCLSSRLDAAGITVLTHTRLIDLVIGASGTVRGVTALSNGHSVTIPARCVVLATGGIGALWSATSNPLVCTGDGLAAALRAGLTIRDPEFMQFHPTVLFIPGQQGRSPLISEAVRGEGAVLLDVTGRRIMTGIHPLKDLAPRDVVSAAEHEAMLATGSDHVLLDATAFGEATWQSRFPTILSSCREHGIDPCTEPIPVAPGAHYHCGGIVAGLDGRTEVPGLLAVGETACTGVHGANRLASNSLTEALIAGERSGRCSTSPVGPVPSPNHIHAVHRQGWLPGEAIRPIRTIMDRDVSLSRHGDGLQRALGELRQIRATAGLDDAALTATNAATIAAAIATAALWRTESRGAHRRRDYPRQDATFRVHTDLRLVEGRPTVVSQRSEKKIA
ncbi:L-aspartate oxidase [Cutibacterium sp. WCA-380-WT-3A]|uniref:L-aspartate oxidase n=1 Tax=Cutibacterium porci TaxID=2605781 RepID=A0A7K0J6V5_9ACTN|nr:L-aspartate oxidase [Cutibacterium porci]MSS45696.1 L-aspartate oxidase [Cutibacterium porci]